MKQLKWNRGILLFAFAVVFSLCATAYAPGDINRDGVVRLNDVLRILKVSAQ